MTQNTRQPHRPRHAEWVGGFITFLIMALGMFAMWVPVAWVWHGFESGTKDFSAQEEIVFAVKQGVRWITVMIALVGIPVVALLHGIFTILEFRHGVLVNELARREERQTGDSSKPAHVAQNLSTTDQK